MKKIYTIFLIFTSALFLKVSGQEPLEDAPYSERVYGTITTDRNFPSYDIDNEQDMKVVPCRKLNKKLLIFSIGTAGNIDIRSFRNKPFKSLTNEEKEKIVIYARYSGEYKLINILHQIILFDTAQESRHLRELSVMCLSVYNSNFSKGILLNLLNSNDKELRMLSALSLVQLGMNDIGFNYIAKNYQHYIFKDQITTALMMINSPQAIDIIKTISEDKDPSYALDASAALALLGYCDLAFSFIIKYKDSDIVFVRQMVAWCLIYYIGTPEAISIIRTLKDDENHFVREEKYKIFKTFNIKQ